MSLAQLFYLKEAVRAQLRQWRRSRRRASGSRRPVNRSTTRIPRPEPRFTLEALEPRLLLSATPVELSVEQPLEPAAVIVPQGPLPSLDVDLNGQADALSDGIVII